MHLTEKEFYVLVRNQSVGFRKNSRGSVAGGGLEIRGRERRSRRAGTGIHQRPHDLQGARPSGAAGARPAADAALYWWTVLARSPGSGRAEAAVRSGRAASAREECVKSERSA